MPGDEQRAQRLTVYEIGATSTGTYRSRLRPGLVQLDACHAGAVRELLRRVRPDVIFFPAAEPNVDWCETHPEEARRRNLGPLLGTLSAAEGIPIIGFSSDYVFDGERGPYRETDEPHPISVYGRLKAELEAVLLGRGHAVIRTTTVFGWEPEPARSSPLMPR